MSFILVLQNHPIRILYILDTVFRLAVFQVRVLQIYPIRTLYILDIVFQLGVFQLRVHFLLILQIHPVRILYTLDIVFRLVIFWFMNTFPICTPKSSNQNTVYIGYSILIGYFSLYYYISYLYSKIIQSEHCIYWMQYPDWLFQVPCTVEPV